MPPQHMIGLMQQASIGTELIYSFVIILTSLMVYFGTKELYELSSHKGIKYFRLAFLFFAIAYLFRSIIKFAVLFLDLRQIMHYNPYYLGPLTQFAFIYFSSMAVFFLLYSVLWKKIDKGENRIIFFHLLAILISFLTLIFSSPKFYLFVNLFLFLFVIIIFFISHKHKNKKSKNSLHIIYFLLFLFWFLNILDILIPDVLRTFQLLIYLASIGIFLSILYKVLRKIGTK